MKYWNYRVIEFRDPDGTIYRSIHEVHYDENKSPRAYTDRPAFVQWDVGEDPEEILRLMRDALQRPVLVEGDFDNKVEK